MTFTLHRSKKGKEKSFYKSISQFFVFQKCSLLLYIEALLNIWFRHCFSRLGQSDEVAEILSEAVSVGGGGSSTIFSTNSSNRTPIHEAAGFNRVDCLKLMRWQKVFKKNQLCILTKFFNFFCIWINRLWTLFSLRFNLFLNYSYFTRYFCKLQSDLKNA